MAFPGAQKFHFIKYPAWRPEFCNANAIERAYAQPPLPSVTGE